MNQDELEKKWKDEFESYFKENVNNKLIYSFYKDEQGNYEDVEIDAFWSIYLQACKARQKEFEKELDYSKMFHCPNFVTTDNGYIACDLDKHLLQKELDEAVEVIRLIALTENNNYLAKEFLAKVKRG